MKKSIFSATAILILFSTAGSVFAQSVASLERIDRAVEDAEALKRDCVQYHERLEATDRGDFKRYYRDALQVFEFEVKGNGDIAANDYVVQQIHSIYDDAKACKVSVASDEWVKRMSIQDLGLNPDNSQGPHSAPAR